MIPGRRTAHRAWRATFALAVVAVGLALAGCGSNGDDPPALSGVYVGSGQTSTDALKSYEEWLGRPVHLIEDFASHGNWDDIALRSWNPAWYWDISGLSADRGLIVSLPLMPDDGTTFAGLAHGDHDAEFRAAARNLDEYAPDAIVRLGWEFNGDWYHWNVGNDYEDFAAAWRRIVDAMREEAPGLRFDWNTSLGVEKPGGARFGAAEVDRTWPGDDYVDFVGVDVYDQVSEGQDLGAEQRWAALRDGELRLEWWAEFAADHGKRLSIPEWGISWDRPDGGDDNPFYVTQMHDFINSHDVAYHSYFEVDAPDGSHRLQPGTQPNSTAAFLELFSPSGTQSASTRGTT